MVNAEVESSIRISITITVCVRMEEKTEQEKQEDLSEEQNQGKASLSKGWTLLEKAQVGGGGRKMRNPVRGIFF